MNILRNTIDYLAPITTFNRKGSSLRTDSDDVYRFSSDYGNGLTSSELFYSLLSANDFTDLDIIKDDNIEIRNKISIDRYDVQEKLNYHTFGKKKIPEQRVKGGFNSGLIDLGAASILKTDRGWIDHNMNIVAPSDSSYSDIHNYCQNNAILVPSFTLSELDEIETSGKLIVGKHLVAEKNQDGNWIGAPEFFDGNYPNGKQFVSGEVVRLIAHSNLEVAIYGHMEKSTLYHGSVTNCLTPESEHITRKNSSMQGEGVYFTGSVNEAVKVYANPKSFEISGKLIAQEEKEGIDRKNFVFGHLYEGSTSASLFPATFESGYMIDNLMPSLSAFLVVAREYGGNDVFASMEWHRMKDGGSSYSVYQSIDVINSLVPGNEVLPKLFKSLGFEGVSVEFPTPESIKNIKRQINELNDLDNSHFRAKGLAKQPVVDRLTTSLRMIEDSIPSRAEKKHVIVFDDSLIEKKHLKTLPINSGSYEKQSEPYCHDYELKIDDIMELNSPDFDTMKRYWKSLDGDKENEMSL